MIIVAGKGGTGKSTFSAALARVFQEAGEPFAMVDADPSGTLCDLLAVEAPAVAQELDEDADITRDDLEALLTPIPQGGVMLRMGHHLHEGCFCRINAMTRALMTLLVNRYSRVIMDNEAGLEHITRGAGVSGHLVLMGDESLASLRVARDVLDTIRALGDGRPLVQGVGHLLVRAQEDDGVRGVLVQKAADLGLPEPVFLPSDAEIARVQLMGDPFPQRSDFIAAVGRWADAHVGQTR
jgi:CO dehydrogenase maturation factor